MSTSMVSQERLPIVFYLVSLAWITCVTIGMRRLDTFMRSRINAPITWSRFFAEVAARLLLISTGTSLSVYWYGVGLITGKTFTYAHQLWPLHVFHTCMLGSLVVMRLESIYFESRLGKAELSWLVLLVETVNSAYITMIGYRHVAMVVSGSEPSAHNFLFGTI